MTRENDVTIDPALDLVLERIVDVSPEKVWAAWTKPEHIKQWFTPKPWKTVECDIDLRPGGEFRFVMQSPEGQNQPAEVNCYLEVVPNRRLVWTNALRPGFRPAPAPAGQGPECAALVMTAVLLLEPHGKGTRYTAIAQHKDEAATKSHKDMGFDEGWGAALDQLVELMKKS